VTGLEKVANVMGLTRDPRDKDKAVLALKRRIHSIRYAARLPRSQRNYLGKLQTLKIKEGKYQA